MQQVEAYQRGVLFTAQSRAAKAKTEEKNSDSALLSTMGRTFIKAVLQKVNTGS